jgi:hypothetical protein
MGCSAVCGAEQELSAALVHVSVSDACNIASPCHAAGSIPIHCVQLPEKYSNGVNQVRKLAVVLAEMKINIFTSG